MALSRFYSLRAREKAGSSGHSSRGHGHGHGHGHIPGNQHLQPQPQPPPPPQPAVPFAASSSSSISQLVAFRYEETIQAELPIILPPPRNPLRNSCPRPTTISLPARSKSAATATHPSAPAAISHGTSSLPPPRPQSHVVAPPLYRPQPQLQPQPRPRPPRLLPCELEIRQEDHPALRTTNDSLPNNQRQSQDSSYHLPSSSSTTYADSKRDSALGTLSSASTTVLPDDEDHNKEYTTCVEIVLEGTPSSIYSTHEWPLPPLPAPHSLRASTLTAATSTTTTSSTNSASTPFNSISNAQNVPRFSCQSRWSLTESDVSDSASLKARLSTRRLIRGFSLRPGSMKRATKKQSQAEATATAPTAAAAHPQRDPGMDPRPADHSKSSSQSHSSPAPQVSFSPKRALADPSSQEIGDNDGQFPTPSNPGPLSSSHENLNAFVFSSASAPTINTDIPQGNFLEDMEDYSFSKRGSIYFGGTRAISASIPSFAPDFMDKFTEPRPAPPTPTSPAHGASNGRPSTSDSKFSGPRQSKDVSVPDIRVMSDDTERKSQKVRSLYESTDVVHCEDGPPGRRSGELLEPPSKEVPSDGDSNIASRGFRENRKSVRALYLSPTSPTSVTSLPSSRGDNPRRNEFELAGGIEDWEDVQGEDVDRYGFITVENQRSLSSMASHAAETRSLSPSNGRRNGRNVLTKRSRGPPLSQGLAKIPSRKVSVRSMNTQASAVSTSSRLSFRSGVRSAANVMPYNRNRKIIDAAPDMLSLPPGLADIEEEKRTAQAIRAAQELESRRAEKWRKMAKIVTNVKDAKGTKVEAHNLKKDLHIKFDTEDLARGAGKGSPKDLKHLEIQTMEIEFDTNNPKVIERTWKGIPDRWRAAAWYSFLATSAKNANSTITDQGLIDNFHRLQEESSSDDLQIDLDVPRTINKHIMFRKRYRGGQRLLFRVLHAMSLHFPECGYVQGMAALAASLLCYYDEERCFIMMVRLWQYRGLERLYERGFAGLMIALQDLEKYWLYKKPLSQKLTELNIDPTAYGTRWYLTLFNLSIPFPIQLRVWDVFMLLGGTTSKPEMSSGHDKHKAKAKVVKEDEELLTFNGLDILHATAATLIDMHKDIILDGDFENVMKSLTGYQHPTDENQFINTVRAEWNEHRKRKRG